jgi:carbonic anhydrase
MVVMRKRRKREEREKKGKPQETGAFRVACGDSRVGSMLAVGRGESTTYSQ